MSKTVGVIHEARTNYHSISPVGFLFGGVCVAHPVRFLCCAGSFYLSLFCVLCSALSVSLDCPFSVTYNQYSSKILKNARNVLQMKQGLLWLVFDTHKIAGFSSTRYPPQGLRFRNIFK